MNMNEEKWSKIPLDEKWKTYKKEKDACNLLLAMFVFFGVILIILTVMWEIEYAQQLNNLALTESQEYVIVKNMPIDCDDFIGNPKNIGFTQQPYWIVNKRCLK
jgi:hypothetical protein